MKEWTLYIGAIITNDLTQDGQCYRAVSPILTDTNFYYARPEADGLWERVVEPGPEIRMKLDQIIEDARVELAETIEDARAIHGTKE